VKRLAGALGALLAAASAAAPTEPVDPGAPPLCEAAVSLEPVRAVPGQQVRYRLRLLVRSDVSDVAWEEPPAFPGLRAERLGVRALAEPSLRDGASYELREDARALFAERAGRVVLPSARLSCRTPGGQEASVATPEAVLLVVPLPVPTDTDGLVGPLLVRSSVTPRRVALGQSVRVAVTLQGEGNLWDAAPPELPSETLEGAEVFHRRSELLLDRGARLVVRRHFAIDVVPRREGTLRIPSLAWSYFDPATGGTATAATEAVDVTVGPRIAVGDVGERSPTSPFVLGGPDLRENARSEEEGR
jgi:hypothetical protein